MILPVSYTHQNINQLSETYRQAIGGMIMNNEIENEKIRYEIHEKVQKENGTNINYNEWMENNIQILRKEYEMFLSGTLHINDSEVSIYKKSKAGRSEECADAYNALSDAFKDFISDEEKNEMRLYTGENLKFDIEELDDGGDHSPWIRFDKTSDVQYEKSRFLHYGIIDLNKLSDTEDFLGYLRIFDSLSEKHRLAIAQYYSESRLNSLNVLKKSSMENFCSEDAVQSDYAERTTTLRKEFDIISEGRFEEEFLKMI